MARKPRRARVSTLGDASRVELTTTKRPERVRWSVVDTDPAHTPADYPLKVSGDGCAMRTLGPGTYVVVAATIVEEE